MNELYSVMEQMLEVDYKLECVEHVSKLPFEKMDGLTKDELISFVKLFNDSVRCALSLNKTAISELDLYIARNASKARNDKES